MLVRDQKSGRGAAEEPSCNHALHSQGGPARAVAPMLADILSQINGRKTLPPGGPKMAKIALRNIERRAKHKVNMV